MCKIIEEQKAENRSLKEDSIGEIISNMKKLLDNKIKHSLLIKSIAEGSHNVAIKKYYARTMM